MSRTILQIPTTLFGDELTSRLEMFLQCHKFRKDIFWGEELYKSSHWFFPSVYFKLIPKEGFLQVEAFYFKKGRKGWPSRELKIGTGFLGDPRDMQGKLR